MRAALVMLLAVSVAASSLAIFHLHVSPMVRKRKTGDEHTSDSPFESFFDYEYSTRGTNAAKRHVLSSLLEEGINADGVLSFWERRADVVDAVLGNIAALMERDPPFKTSCDRWMLYDTSDLSPHGFGSQINNYLYAFLVSISLRRRFAVIGRHNLGCAQQIVDSKTVLPSMLSCMFRPPLGALIAESPLVSKPGPFACPMPDWILPGGADAGNAVVTKVRKWHGNGKHRTSVPRLVASTPFKASADASVIIADMDYVRNAAFNIIKTPKMCQDTFSFLTKPERDLLCSRGTSACDEEAGHLAIMRLMGKLALKLQPLAKDAVLSHLARGSSLRIDGGVHIRRRDSREILEELFKYDFARYVDLCGKPKADNENDMHVDALSCVQSMEGNNPGIPLSKYVKRLLRNEKCNLKSSNSRVYVATDAFKSVSKEMKYAAAAEHVTFAYIGAEKKVEHVLSKYGHEQTFEAEIGFAHNTHVLAELLTLSKAPCMAAVLRSNMPNLAQILRTQAPRSVMDLLREQDQCRFFFIP